MSTNNPMTQEQLAEIQARADSTTPLQLAVPGDTNRIALYHSDDVDALLAEVERLRARLTVDEDMVERAARESYGPQMWDRLLSDWHATAPVKLAAHRAMTRAVLDATLNPGEGS